MKITIIIPTVCFDRLEMLLEEVKSIEAGKYQDFHIVIIVDGNQKLYEELQRRLLPFKGSIILNEKRRGWVASTNRIFKEFDSDYYIYASDDLVFPPDCIKNAMIMMKDRFPDGYGVITLGRKTKCIFGLIGRKWVEHFPGRQVLCPFYVHYGADAEHTAFAHKIEKFAFHPNRPSQVTHYRINDRTRIFSRSSRQKDLALWENRKAKGLIWGVSFER